MRLIQEFVHGIYLGEQGFVVHPSPHRTHSADLFNTGNLSSVVLNWGDDFLLTATDPWPRVRVRHSSGTLELAPRTMMGLVSPLEFERRMEDSLRAIAARVPDKVDLGWMALPVVRWERVSALPALAEELDAAGSGAYRSGRPVAEEVALAVRGAPSSLEVMLDWLASTPERSWQDHPRQVRLTEDAIYIEQRGGRCFRLPLTDLRRREGRVDEDAVYVFGRRTRLVLPYRASGCAVRERLDERLE